jgi:hypothetical protein
MADMSDNPIRKIRRQPQNQPAMPNRSLKFNRHRLRTILPEKRHENPPGFFLGRQESRKVEEGCGEEAKIACLR